MSYARAVAQTHRMLRTADDERSASPDVVYVPVRLENGSPGLPNDPAFRKLCQDVEDVGGVFFQDLDIQPPPAFPSLVRLYIFPNHETVCSLSFAYGKDESRQLHLFPAYATFHVRTNLAGGGRLTCINGGDMFRKQRLPTGVMGRQFRNVSEPGEMLKKHLHVLQKAEAQGHARAPLGLETIVARMNTERREYADLPQKQGCFRWADAFRMVFNAPRREYAEDA